MNLPKEYNFQLRDSERKFSETWKKIQSKSEFHDVTLACDGYQLNAHKVILSSFSPVLQQILTSNYHQHPLIYLSGIRYSILDSILQFIYKGEVGISQESVKEFLSVANEFKIKGLYEDDREQSISINISETDFFANYIDSSNSFNQLSIVSSQNVIESEEQLHGSDDHESLPSEYNKGYKIEELQRLDEAQDNNESLTSEYNEGNKIEELQRLEEAQDNKESINNGLNMDHIARQVIAGMGDGGSLSNTHSYDKNHAQNPSEDEFILLPNLVPEFSALAAKSDKNVSAEERKKKKGTWSKSEDELLKMSLKNLSPIDKAMSRKEQAKLISSKLTCKTVEQIWHRLRNMAKKNNKSEIVQNLQEKILLENDSDKIGLKTKLSEMNKVKTQFTCDKCAKQFTRDDNLKRHFLKCNPKSSIIH